MTRPQTALAAAAIALSLVACNDARHAPKSEATHTDADGLIEYAMPDGWTNARISTGNHYTRSDESADSAILGVIPRQRGSAPSIEQVMEGTAGKHDIQGHRMISERTSDMNGFFVWEAVYNAEMRGREVVFHDSFLFTDELQVEVHLNVARVRYEDFLPDLRTVVGSIAVRSGTE